MQTIHHCTPLHAYHASLYTVTYRPYITVLHYMQTIHHCTPLHADHTSLFTVTYRPYIIVHRYIQTIHHCTRLHADYLSTQINDKSHFHKMCTPRSYLQDWHCTSGSYWALGWGFPSLKSLSPHPKRLSLNVTLHLKLFVISHLNYIIV